MRMFQRPDLFFPHVSLRAVFRKRSLSWTAWRSESSTRPSGGNLGWGYSHMWIWE